MIRILGTRIILPQGDTGSFILPNKEFFFNGDIAVFSIKNPLTQETLVEKILDASEEFIYVNLEYEDTKKLPKGKYFWDIKIYHGPLYDEDGILLGATGVDSYYSAFEQPLLIIKEVAKSYG